MAKWTQPPLVSLSQSVSHSQLMTAW
eukprot:COSAG03_NODE_25597_length_264_cov_1.242424_1_plen_25_part_10